MSRAISIYSTTYACHITVRATIAATGTRTAFSPSVTMCSAPSSLCHLHSLSCRPTSRLPHAAPAIAEADDSDDTSDNDSDWEEEDEDWDDEENMQDVAFGPPAIVLAGEPPVCLPPSHQAPYPRALSETLSSPALFLHATNKQSGWSTAELVAARLRIDSLGGRDIPVIPTTPELLRLPMTAAVTAPEIDWGSEIPRDWVEGGGWGRAKMVMFSGLT